VLSGRLNSRWRWQQWPVVAAVVAAAAAAGEVMFQKPLISDHLGSFEEHEDLGWLVGGGGQLLQQAYWQVGRLLCHHIL